MAPDNDGHAILGRIRKKGLPVSCMTFLPIRTFTAQNTEGSGRNSAWLEFTASEDKPHAQMVVLARHSRESGNDELLESVPGLIGVMANLSAVVVTVRPGRISVLKKPPAHVLPIRRRLTVTPGIDSSR